MILFPSKKIFFVVIIFCFINIIFNHFINDAYLKTGSENDNFPKINDAPDFNTEEKIPNIITNRSPTFHGVAKCHPKRNISHDVNKNVIYSRKNSGNTSIPLIGSHSNTRCALLFFGLPRLFRPIVLPSIEKYIIAFNPSCDVFLHTYNVTSISNVRSGEKNDLVSPTDTYLLTNNTYIESMYSFHSQRNLSEFRPYHEPDWGECCENIDNLVKQWHSVEGVWKLMQRYGKKMMNKELNKNGTDHYYERVGLFRSDVVYLTPIDINDGDAVVPRFLWPGANHLTNIFVNDRMFYGTYDFAKIWATERFSFTKEFLKKFNTLRGETFLRVLMSHKNIPIRRDDICFWRARASGKIQFEACSVECIEEDLFELLTEMKEYRKL